jgi:hypothetical protein
MNLRQQQMIVKGEIRLSRILISLSGILPHTRPKNVTARVTILSFSTAAGIVAGAILLVFTTFVPRIAAYLGMLAILAVAVGAGVGVGALVAGNVRSNSGRS